MHRKLLLPLPEYTRPHSCLWPPFCQAVTILFLLGAGNPLSFPSGYFCFAAGGRAFASLLVKTNLSRRLSEAMSTAGVERAESRSGQE